jgi:apolipoprotein N-acyltransferase
VAGHSTENCNRLRREIYELINDGSIKLNPVEQELLEDNNQTKANNITPEGSINFIEEKDNPETEATRLFKKEICKPGKQDMHVAIIGDNPTSQEEEGPKNYTATAVIFPEI